jgi:hypothetical protein
VSGLLEAERDAGRSDLGERGRRAARWVLDKLWVERGGYFAYHPCSPKNIHNANMLGAWLVFAALGDDAQVRERVMRAVERTLAWQQPDGSWPYGEEQSTRWADSFHSGNVLFCLDRLRRLDPAVDEAVARGARYFERFFDGRGRAKLWAHRDYPEDAHSAGTGLTTLALLLRRGVVPAELLDRVAARVLDAGIRDGHAVFRRYRVGRSRVHYLRWCDAHLALGLADSALALAGLPDPAPAPAIGAARR